MTSHTTPLRLTVADHGAVSARLQTPPGATACLVLAHGAGAGMMHPFMQRLADALAAHSVATLRFQFPSMERGSKRPDRPEVARATVRAAVAAALGELAGLPLFAGGKSFGARMTSQAQSERPLEGVRGLVFAGFPLHPAGRPASTRADHLQGVQVPMLFLQGTRDALADLALLRPVVAALGPRATLRVFDDADHAFHVRAKSGSNDEQVMQAMAASAAGWMAAVVGGEFPS